ncbi:Aste57867_6007 [Aphanomyces stellatus]|uniref:Aste57867_6007 protein n=1 Tax=Aphanomyces stellatus TaxID=120398 RepID=A0A485KF05_9STRA|nr:hypothetical protein As57867_005993 [Aphanomyces stellatus]VFT83021.1 Aste57867_6007 [Aphanomyces stellatus]
MEVPVRIHIGVRAYDVSCQAQHAAETLLVRARELATDHAGPLDALYNKTRHTVIDLGRPLGSCVAPNDDVEAMSLLALPDRSFLGRFPSNVSIQDSDALFYQQMCAFDIVGQTLLRHHARKDRAAKKAARNFASLLQLYYSNPFDADGNLPKTVSTALPAVPVRVLASPAPAAPRLGPLQPPPRPPPQPTRPAPQLPRPSAAATAMSPLSSPDASAFTTDNESSSSESEQPHASPPAKKQELDNMFDVVFTQNAIGLKLVMDPMRKYATVRECLEKSEASRYPAIVPGVAIVSVNGQSVVGIGLTRTLVKLREAPRPLVVRFGHTAATSSVASWHDGL